MCGDLLKRLRAQNKSVYLEILLLIPNYIIYGS